MNQPRLALALLFSLALTACATAPESAPVLDGTHWALVSADKGELAKLAPTSGITLGFAPDAIFGYGGCNQYRGGYSLAEGVLAAGAVAATKRLCPGEASAAEAAWLALLGAPLALTATGETLELRSTDGTVLRFAPGSPPKP
ncbi:MAG: META domain-containing protein [Chiayiivirga sp.]|jgi:heat shock protein HslJ|uniref:META domain-containing protein n=1 Tax=Chiayiivirga sp. TaxID=2041042 RepID=UPI0025BB13A1|nr:META domain-containing protein [Chiayiivirga sp.]MCI1709097.1 META domain-containing protein [Chiayiivirga sp.]MCI1729290.1 META domain-containing protein [Chiayiivirga sp.]